MTSGVRLKALDGLRAISVVLVFFANYHWTLPFGWLGVLVFYVLSGYLITRILLQERELSHNGAERGARAFFGRFYFRRTLRIFPLYFAYLIGLSLLHAAIGVPEQWPGARPYAFTYTINFGIMSGDVPASPALGHLWTLSVEEQFYLVWPLVVWLLPRTALARAALVLIALGPVVRFACAELFGMSAANIYMLSTSHLDSFAAGAALASLDLSRARKVAPLAAGFIAFTLALGLLVIKLNGQALRTLGYAEGLALSGGYVWGYSVLNIASGLVILAALRGELPWLEQRALAYLGQISYGIYIAQRPIKGVYMTYVEPAALDAMPRMLALTVGAVICGAISVLIAAGSYRYFEAPLLAWRDRKVPPHGRA